MLRDNDKNSVCIMKFSNLACIVDEPSITTYLCFSAILASKETRRFTSTDRTDYRAILRNHRFTILMITVDIGRNIYLKCVLDFVKTLKRLFTQQLTSFPS